MMIVMLIHSKIGCETIAYDYIKNDSLQKTFKIFINFITFILLILVIGSIYKLSLI